MDTRIRFSTAKVVDLYQLDEELGGHGLCGDADEIVVPLESPVTLAQLQAAVAAHTPRHKPLDSMGKLITLLSVYQGQMVPPCEELVKMVPGLTVEDVQAEFYDWLAFLPGGES